MSVDSNDQSNSPERASQPVPGPEPIAPSEPTAEPESPVGESPASGGEGATDPARRRPILIGSQRDPAAYRARPRHDWIPVQKRKPIRKTEQGGQDESPAKESEAARGEAVAPASPPPQPLTEKSPTVLPAILPQVPAVTEPPKAKAPPPEKIDDLSGLSKALTEEVQPGAPIRDRRFPPPSRRDRLSAEQEAEFNQALGDVPLDDLMAGGETVSAQAMLEPESRHAGRVVAVQRGDVFVELGSREQGILPLAQLAEPPEPGATIDVMVARFNRDEGLYELTLPNASIRVEDWSDLSEGMVVDAHVTGHNAGGLECEVHHIRGFIPVSQISLYRVEDMAEFVGQRFPCVVTEANPQRRNLVLSRRDVLEREREEARRAIFESLAPGQVREGVVRKLVDFGAFVDLGSGVDGLLHISQMSWARIGHPREVFQEGQALKVRIEKVDAETGRISLTYREMLENPWTNIEKKYPPRSPVRGKVVKLMEFGAFVELEPGVEGLIHISELARKRVWRVSDIVKEGEEVEVMVLAVDPDAKRISLSMKDLLPPEPEPAKAPDEAQQPPPAPKPQYKPTQPLQGGLGRVSDGGRFGLKW